MQTLKLSALALLAASVAQAQPADPMGSTNRNRLSLSYRMGFNMSAAFKNLGGYTALTAANNPLKTPGGRNRYNYDNGYVYDDLVLPENMTHYYGYVRGTHLAPNDGPVDFGPEFDLYRSAAPASMISDDNYGDPQHGFELTYSRQFGRLGKAFWGLEAGVGFQSISVSDGRTVWGPSSRQVDTYQAAAPTLSTPYAAYPFEGPQPGDPGWPWVFNAPVGRAMDYFFYTQTITGRRQFDADVVTLRFGPYLEIPMGNRWNFSLNGGFALFQINSSFRYDETVALSPSATLVRLPAQRHLASWSDSGIEVGGYIGGAFAYSINERFRLFTGAQLMIIQNYSQTVAGKQAVLDFGRSLFVNLGLQYTF